MPKLKKSRKIIKYIVLDTNIFVSFLESGIRSSSQAGIYNVPEDIDILRQLVKACDDNKLVILLPEVIKLELKRIKYEKDEDLVKIYDEALPILKAYTSSTSRQFTDKSLLNIKSSFDILCQAERDKNQLIWELFNKIFNHRNTITLSLDESILLAAYKRGLIGKKPYVMGYSGRSTDFKKGGLPSHHIQPDSVIVESVVSFLKGKTDFELYLATNDHSFYTNLEKKELDPDIKSELKVYYSSRNLSDLLIKAIGLKITVKPILKSEEQAVYPQIGKDVTEEGNTSNDSDVVRGT